MCTVIGILVTGSTSLDLLVSFNAAVSTIVCLPAVPAGNSKMYNASPRPSVAEGPTSLIFFKAMQLEGFRALAETHPQQAGQPKGVPGLQNPYEFFGDNFKSHYVAAYGGLRMLQLRQGRRSLRGCPPEMI